MLKFLRRYSQWILVIGGTLLMIAFLLPTTINEFGKQPIFTTVMWIDGDRVGRSEYELAWREHAAMSRLTAGMLPAISNVENDAHWLLLVHEAERGGYIAGKGEGKDFLPDLVRQMLFASGRAYQMSAEELESGTKAIAAGLELGMTSVQSEFQLTEAQLHTALAKLHGIIRMQVAYMRAPRFSDRRLAAGMKRMQDRAEVEYVFVPPDQVMAEIPDPAEAEITAHFAKYGDVEAGTGDVGFGYRQPDRIKLEWLAVDLKTIGEAVKPDPVEIHKRFIKAYPSGNPPEGQTLEQAKAPFETQVRTELVEKVMKAADQAIRGEYERALRRTQPDGLYRTLPADWNEVRPDLIKVRDAVVARVKDQTGITIPGPTITKRSGTWLTKRDAPAVEGIGRAFLQRGRLQEPFASYVFNVRELAGDNDFALQVGVPSEALTDFTGNRFYLVITEARKASAPESLEEVRPAVVMDLKKLAAFEKLKTQLDAFREQSLGDGGLQALADAEGSSISQPKKATAIASGFFPSDPNIASDDFRKALLEIASKIDPGVNVLELPAADRTVAMPIPKAFGLAIARVVGVTPVTEDLWRRSQTSIAANLVREELKVEDPKDNPFSFARLRERLKVEYKDKRMEPREPGAESPDSDSGA